MDLDRNNAPQGLEPRTGNGLAEREHNLQSGLERIYQHIFMEKQAGGDHHRHLRYQEEGRMRLGSYVHRGRLKNVVSIVEPPGIMDTRQHLRDW